MITRMSLAITFATVACSPIPKECDSVKSVSSVVIHEPGSTKPITSPIGLREGDRVEVRVGVRAVHKRDKLPLVCVPFLEQSFPPNLVGTTVAWHVPMQYLGGTPEEPVLDYEGAITFACRSGGRITSVARVPFVGNLTGEAEGRTLTMVARVVVGEVGGLPDIRGPASNAITITCNDKLPAVGPPCSEPCKCPNGDAPFGICAGTQECRDTCRDAEPK